MGTLSAPPHLPCPPLRLLMEGGAAETGVQGEGRGLRAAFHCLTPVYPSPRTSLEPALTLSGQALPPGAPRMALETGFRIPNTSHTKTWIITKARDIQSPVKAGEEDWPGAWGGPSRWWLRGQAGQGYAHSTMGGGQRAPRDVARGQLGHGSSGWHMLVGSVCQCGHFLLLGRLAGLPGCQQPRHPHKPALH